MYLRMCHACATHPGLFAHHRFRPLGGVALLVVGGVLSGFTPASTALLAYTVLLSSVAFGL